MPAPLHVRRGRPLLAAALLVLAPHAAPAQDVLRLPGKTVEVIGLEDWTIPMLQDSLRKYADGVTLDSHACAGVLRTKLGFADAAVQTFAFQGQDEYVAVSVVEPADSARVRRLRNVGEDTVAVRGEWMEAAEIAWRRPWAYQVAVQWPERAVPPFALRDSADFRRLWTFWDAHAADADREAALAVLQADPNVQNRMLAPAILAAAPHTDDTWRTLVAALLDTDGRVASMASASLQRIASSSPRVVDWGPAAADVHALLDGSSLFGLDPVMQALLASGVDGRWAAPFLAGGGHAVLARLDAESPRMSAPAHQLLVALRGEDLGTDSAPWRAWVASLGR